MLGRLAAAAALIALAGCAGVESAGRNARTGDQPTRVAAAPPPVQRPAPQPAPVAAPPPQVATPAPQVVAAPPPPAVQPAPQVVTAPPPAPRPAPVVTAAPAAPVATTPPPQRVEAQPPQQLADAGDQRVSADTAEEQVIARGQRERQVRAPNGDPRSASERMQDIRAWDQCVMRVQNAFEADPMSANLDQPEDVCARSLGMAERTSVPQSRLERGRPR